MREYTNRWPFEFVETPTVSPIVMSGMRRSKEFVGDLHLWNGFFKLRLLGNLLLGGNLSLSLLRQEHACDTHRAKQK